VSPARGARGVKEPRTTGLLRPALEAAVVVARAGEHADPVEPAPAGLRPYLRFAKLPAPALEVTRKVLDSDERFRRRVAESVTLADVGPAAWLWLTRPDGWEERFDRMHREATDLEIAERDRRAEQDARKRLARAEDAARRAETRAEAAARQVEELESALIRERAARQDAESELDGLRATASTLGDERNAAVRAMKRTEAELASRTADLRDASRHQARLPHSNGRAWRRPSPRRRRPRARSQRP
jgi:hypothetical protein